MRDSTELRYVTGDHQDTSLIAINATDQKTITRRFTSFGQERGVTEDTTWPGDKGFVGGTKDPTGLTHLGAREYDPDTSRFTTVDPVMDPTDPQQLNGYSYANNNPVTTSDPDGLIPDGLGSVVNWARARQGLSPLPHPPDEVQDTQAADDALGRSETLGNNVIVAPSEQQLIAAINKARGQVPDKLKKHCDAGNEGLVDSCRMVDGFLGKYICEDDPDWCVTFDRSKEIPAIIAAAVAAKGKKRPSHNLKVVIFNKNGKPIREATFKSGFFDLPPSERAKSPAMPKPPLIPNPRPIEPRRAMCVQASR